VCGPPSRPVPMRVAKQVYGLLPVVMLCPHGGESSGGDLHMFRPQCSEPTKSMVEEEPRVSKLNIPPPGEGRRGVVPKFASTKHFRSQQYSLPARLDPEQAFYEQRASEARALKERQMASDQALLEKTLSMRKGGGRGAALEQQETAAGRRRGRRRDEAAIDPSDAEAELRATHLVRVFPSAAQKWEGLRSEARPAPLIAHPDTALR